MRLAVTGASGFIGSHLCDRLIDCGHYVIAMDKYFGINLADTIKRANFEFVGVDLIAQHNDVKKILSGVDMVIHAAAQAGTGPSWGKFSHYLQSNVVMTANILEACSKLIYISSSSVYGRDVNNSAEDAPLNPTSPYGVTKAAAEMLCKCYREWKDIKLVIIRPFSIYGPRQRPDMYHHIFIKKILAEEMITIDSDGNQSRCNTYISDLIDGIVGAIHSLSINKEGIFNIGGGEVVTILDTIKMIEDLTGLRARLHFGPERVGDQRITIANIDNARRELGYEPKVSLREGLMKQIEWQMLTKPLKIKSYSEV